MARGSGVGRAAQNEAEENGKGSNSGSAALLVAGWHRATSAAFAHSRGCLVAGRVRGVEGRIRHDVVVGQRVLKGVIGVHRRGWPQQMAPAHVELVKELDGERREESG